MWLRRVLGAALLLPCMLTLPPHRDMEEDLATDRERSPNLDQLKSVDALHVTSEGDRGADGLEGELMGEGKEPVCDDQSHSLARNTAADSTAAMLKELEARLRSVGGVMEDEPGPADRLHYGLCSGTETGHHGWWSPLSVLAKRVSAEQGRVTFHVLYPTKEVWDLKGAADRRRLSVNLYFPLSLTSRLHRVTPVLLFNVQDFTEVEGLTITFTGHSLYPHQQPACLSLGTRLVLLTGRETDTVAQSHLLWWITVETKQAGSKLSRVFTEERTGHNATLHSPLLLLMSSGDKEEADQPERTELRESLEMSSSLASAVPSGTFRFLCELRMFLSEALSPAELGPVPSQAAPVSLNTLWSLPSITLGSTASESLLLGLLNSSAPTLFSFPHHTSDLRAHRVELALQPHLLAILRGRLEEAISQMVTDDVGGRSARERLRRLQELSALPEDQQQKEEVETPTDLADLREKQYHALLLLKALQTIQAAWEGQRGERAARGGDEDHRRCGLHSLTMSVIQPLLEPSVLPINNCWGSCSVPVFRGTNHAILLNSYSGKQPLERTPCCVPEHYEALLVAEVTGAGTKIHFKPDMVAKECGCR